MKKLLLAGIASLALGSGANADVQIKMKPGAQCWSYQGYNTRFYGDFAGGQALTVAFVFQVMNDHGRITTTAYNGDRVWVNAAWESSTKRVWRRRGSLRLHRISPSRA